MASGADSKSGSDPFKNVLMFVDAYRYTRGAPMLLQGSIASELSFSSVDWAGKSLEFRLGIVSDTPSNYDLTPDAETWVKADAGKVKWSITPKSTDGNLTLVLYSRSFTETMEFRCEFFTADHPWYPNSKFYIFTPTDNGFFAHKGNMFISQSDYQYNIQLYPEGRELIGKEIKLTLEGGDGVPEVTPSGSRPMGAGGLKWYFSFDQFAKIVPITARVEGEGVPSSTTFNFLPTEGATAKIV
jgi:hypothetical protein